MNPSSETRSADGGRPQLLDVLKEKRSEILDRWLDRVRGTYVPESMPQPELTDGLPRFLDELAESLVRQGELQQLKSPAEHGEQRLRLGFSLEAVIREYGALWEAMLECATEECVDVPRRELEILFRAILEGVALAVSEYVLRRDAEMLRQANEQFAFIAHELRNPLSSAISAVDLIRAGGPSPDPELVDILDRGLHHLADMIDHALQTARIASGVELRKMHTTLEQLVVEVEQDVSLEARRKGVHVWRDLRDGQPFQVDVRLVRSALGNLASNAVKFTPAGGEVRIHGRVENQRAVIEVEDACGGLPPGMVEKAFAPFVRMDRRHGGFGLGLAIARQAVEAHGGSIRVQNLPGKGCMFVLDIPVEDGGESERG